VPPNEPPVNPYQSPSEAGQLLTPAVQTRNLEHFKLLKQFRQQIHALGGFWIFIGGLEMAAAIGVAMSGWGDTPEEGTLIAIFFGASGAIWLALGIAACFKKLWTVYLGLGLSYLLVVANLLSLNVCVLIVLAVVILQGHRVLGFAKRLKWLGIPLTTRPSQLTMQVAPPPGQWPV